MFILLFFRFKSLYNLTYVRDETHSYIRKGRICMHRPGSTKMLICSEPIESKIKNVNANIPKNSTTTLLYKRLGTSTCRTLIFAKQVKSKNRGQWLPTLRYKVFYSRKRSQLNYACVVFFFLNSQSIKLHAYSLFNAGLQCRKRAQFATKGEGKVIF